MKTIATDKTNDIFLKAGDLALATDQDAVANVCLNRVRTLQGELQYSLKEGIPYFDVLAGQRPNITLFKDYLQRELLQVDGVTAVKSLSTNFINGNELIYTAELTTNEGVIKI